MKKEDQKEVHLTGLLLRKIAGKKQTEIIDYLEDNGTVSVKDIALALKIDKVYLSRLLIELKDLGILVKDRRNYSVNKTRLGLIRTYCSSINVLCGAAN